MLTADLVVMGLNPAWDRRLPRTVSFYYQPEKLITTDRMLKYYNKIKFWFCLDKGLINKPE